MTKAMRKAIFDWWRPMMQEPPGGECWECCLPCFICALFNKTDVKCKNCAGTYVDDDDEEHLLSCWVPPEELAAAWRWKRIGEAMVEKAKETNGWEAKVTRLGWDIIVDCREDDPLTSLCKTLGLETDQCP